MLVGYELMLLNTFMPCLLTDIEGAGMQDALAAQLQEMEQSNDDAGAVSPTCRLLRGRACNAPWMHVPRLFG